MNFIIKTLVIIAFITTSTNLVAQEEIKNEIDYRQHQFNRFDYEFSGEANQEQLDLLRDEVVKMEFVTEAKVYFKPEKNKGMIRVLTDEFYKDRSSNFEFDIYKLKMLITTFNLTPNECRKDKNSK